MKAVIKKKRNIYKLIKVDNNTMISYIFRKTGLILRKDEEVKSSRVAAYGSDYALP